METRSTPLSDVQSHPCYDHEAHFRVGRLHLPVAARCNIGCGFCDRLVSDCVAASRPGLASRIMAPEECAAAVQAALERNQSIEVVGIAGPGEPLFNEETFSALRVVSEEFPDLKLCVCTNGLLLPEKVGLLGELGVTSVTVTVNAANPETGARINSHCILEGRRYTGKEAAELLLENQLAGIERSVRRGMRVKVNTVLIPDINMSQVKSIAHEVERRGAQVMNIVPLIPMGRFSGLRPPTCDELILARELCEPLIPIFRLCKQCRADACGIPGME